MKIKWPKINPILIEDNKGKKKYVFASYKDWRKLISFAEDLEDLVIYHERMSKNEKTIPWEQVKKDLNI